MTPGVRSHTARMSTTTRLGAVPAADQATADTALSIVMAGLLTVGAVVHFSDASTHYLEWRPAGVALLALATAQTVLASALLLGASRRAAPAVLAVSATAVVA